MLARPLSFHSDCNFSSVLCTNQHCPDPHCPSTIGRWQLTWSLCSSFLLSGVLYSSLWQLFNQLPSLILLKCHLLYEVSLTSLPPSPWHPTSLYFVLFVFSHSTFHLLVFYIIQKWFALRLTPTLLYITENYNSQDSLPSDFWEVPATRGIVERRERKVLRLLLSQIAVVPSTASKSSPWLYLPQ
jgi:hypothetical protein